MYLRALGENALTKSTYPGEIIMQSTPQLLGDHNQNK